MIFSLILFLIMIVYGFFILRLAFGIKKVPYFTTQYQSPETTFTIIVPFRNEAKSLPELLFSISDLNYPADLFEVILVASNFLAVIILYDPISKLFEELIKKYINNKEKN